MSKKTLTLIIGLIILTIILLFVAIQPMLVPQANDPSKEPPNQQNATPTPAAYTTIQLMPNPYAFSASGTGTIEAVVDTKQNEVTVIQLELAYDPDVLTNVQLTPGTFFPNPLTLLENVDQDNGRITYVLGITPAQTPVQGQGVVARISFQRTFNTATQQTQIQLLPKTLVLTEGSDQSVLKTTTDMTITFPTIQPLPSPTTTNITPSPTGVAE